MFKYIVRRLLYMVPILFGVTLVTFTLFNVAGGDPAAQLAGRHATQEQIDLIKKELGLSGSYLEQYLFYVKQIVTFDYGRSWSTKQRVSDMILGTSLDTSPILTSISLTFPAFLITLCIATVFALVMTFNRGKPLDKTLMIVCLAALSVSSLVYILYLQYGMGYKLGWFPISGWETGLLDRARYLAMPIMIFVALSLGSNILFFRTAFIDEMFQDYVRTARAKGLDAKTIMFKHVFRNALIPIITLVVLQIPFLILGTLLIEAFFGIPGVGGLIYEAINNVDFPVIKAITVLSAIMYMIFQLLSDVLYALVDPKVQLR